MDDGQAILIVDDKPANLLTLETVLRPTGAQIVAADSGDEALKLTLQHGFALAILDVQMPGMDGYELAGLMRGSSQTQDIPIIFLSAVYSDDYYVFKGYEAGAVDYMVKPYEREMLLSKVRVFLQLHRQKVELQRHRDLLEEEVAQRTAQLRVANENLQQEMGERERMGQELVRAEKLRTAMATAAGAAHEINQPLQVIVMAAEMLLMRMGADDPARAQLESMIESAGDISRVLAQMKRIREHATVPYPGGGEILDFGAASGDQ